jgi:RNA-splicing ligase RtcB
MMKYDIYCENLEKGHEYQMSKNDILNMFSKKEIKDMLSEEGIEIKKNGYKYWAEEAMNYNNKNSISA